ncbi:MAG: hypothetical protein ACKVS6_03510 [Planctomycetota bacterium]
MIHYRSVAAVLLLAVAGISIVSSVSGSKLVIGGGTTHDDFKQPGTQPNTIVDPVQPSANCSLCHGDYDISVEPYGLWKSSMMAQAARDPLFHACLAIAEQDAPFSGDLCIRCHSPGGWLEGNSTPSDGSALNGKDFDGVNCHVCHRLVDPVFDINQNPFEDQAILASLAQVPAEPHNGTYVIDPLDRRRGPYDLGRKFYWHEWRQSPFHQESQICGTCHDVSNPAFSRTGGPVPAASDIYALNASNAEHPTQLKSDQFPLERTFSEWSLSQFAIGPIEMGGRFGGNKSAVSSCQDCHMPDLSGEACKPGFSGVYRNDLPHHGFFGANTWVQRAIVMLDQTNDLYGPAEESGLTPAEAEDAIARNVDFLTKASDMELTQTGGNLNVRIINQTGHKLPTGYAEGRRMWINVKFFNVNNQLIEEKGFYNFARAQLRTVDTKVYEIHLGIDSALSQTTGLPEGPSFHFALVNKIFKDNRIPPRGFTNAAFEAAQAQPVGATYADGQYWDDTLYTIPAGATKTTATLFYQTTSKEYIEFLRSENVTNNAGRVAYKMWDLAGKSAPVEMDQVSIHLTPP